MNGQLGIFNNVSVDGADFNNPFFGEQRGGQRPPFTFNLDAVQEMVVLSDGANAEFGRSAGGFVNVITKSGANAIHGSAHGYYTSESLSAKAPQPDGTFEPKPEGDRYQAGFTFGGPLLQDKFFYFLSADYQNGNQTKQLDPLRIQPDVVAAFDCPGKPRTRTAPSPAATTPSSPSSRPTGTSPKRTWRRCASTTPGRSSPTGPSTSTPGA